MNITISRRAVVVLGALAALVVAAVIWIPSFLPRAEQEDVAGQSAQHFAEQLFGADYRDQQAWKEGVKATMTPVGYATFELSVAPALWPLISEAAVQNHPSDIKVSVDEAVVLADVTQLGDTTTEWQIRKMTVQFENGAKWPNLETPYTMYAMVSRETGQSEWGVSLMLTEASVNQMTAAKEGTK